MALINSVTIHHQWFVSSIIDDVNKHYEILKEIGRGAYGKVFLARNKHLSTYMAIKCIQKNLIEEKSTFKKEIEILRLLTHANIMKIHEIYESEVLCCIVTDYLSGGELFDKILLEKSLNEQYASSIMRKLFGAVSYCHSRGICHRDLKPENILFVSSDAGSDIKMIDFGMSQVFTEKKFMHSLKGTPHYVAPEVLLGTYTNAVDCWSLGVILFFMLSGRQPFVGNNPREVMESIYNGYFDFTDAIFSNVSNYAKDLIARLLIKDPELRITAEQAFQHPWVNGFSPLPDLVIDSSIFDRMKVFSQSEKMRKITMMYIATKVSEFDVENVKIAFEALDRNGNGIVSFEEFEDGLVNSNLPFDEEFMRVVWRVLDCNRNGGLDYIEFITLCLDCQHYSDEYYVNLAFRYFDRDNDGKISKEELKMILNYSNPEKEMVEKISSIITEVDLNGDGVIDHGEFLNMMKSIY